MRKLTDQELARFEEHGYVVARGFFDGTSFLDQTSAEIETLGKVFDASFSMPEATGRLEKMAGPIRGKFYDALRYLVTLNQLASAEALTGVSRQLGLQLPAVMKSYNIRMDMPSEDNRLFHWHQDITYLLGSLNSLTYWIPFGPVGAMHGSVEVVSGSHKEGMLPVRYTRDGTPPSNKSMSPTDLVLVNEPTENGEVVEADRGDLVVFSQFILHRSVPNRSDKVRWTAQVRHADLAEPEFVAAGYPWGDVTNIYHTNYLAEARLK
ncbi:MAG: phytanoyl-CoA dioxygenase family protein [Xanthobacteraceae bacterium]|nr:phytanoyl-CoA dioxygenase family protein [Xanthobacteraceae bacterium]QYK44514.1 MAG: phytanoyl-CoA dioxygenase family protein [Xanthobacteraceae bacterium]